MERKLTTGQLDSSAEAPSRRVIKAPSSRRSAGPFYLLIFEGDSTQMVDLPSTGTVVLGRSEAAESFRRLESRPTGAPWTYRFFIEFDHQAGDPEADAVLRDISALSMASRVLGTYPRWSPGRRGSVGWKA